MLANLAHVVVRHRKRVIAIWIVLTLFGAFAAGQVSKRWYQSFSIPGYSAYETNQKTLKTFGSGEQAALIPVFRSSGDVTKATGIEQAIAKAAAVNPGSRFASFFTTGSRKLSFTPEAKEHLLRHDWPGNVRELKKLVDLLMAGQEGRVTADA